MQPKIKYYYFFRGTLETHVHFYKGWVDAARERGVPMEMVTVLPVTKWMRQRHLVKKYRAIEYFHVLVSIGKWSNQIVAFCFFVKALLSYDRVVVQLKKRSPALFSFLKKLFPGKLKYVIELEGDPKSESEYLLEHPYKPGFYDEKVQHAMQQAVTLRERIQKSDQVVVLSPHLKQLLISRYPDLPLDLKISVLSTGVDCGQRFFSRALRSEARAQLGLEDRFVMIFIGNAFYSWQNVFRTIEIFKLVKNHLAPHAFLILLIREQDHNIVREFIGELSIPSDSHLLQCVPSEEVTRYLNAADLGTLLRHNHLMNRVASPGKFGDYVACGLPLLMTKGISSYSKMIEKTGYAIILEDMDDDEEILRQIQPFITDDENRREKISEWAKQNVSVESNAEAYVATLRKVAHD
jgi:hypothetical protein